MGVEYEGEEGSMIILSDSEIRAVCERPSILPPSASADDYQMERYRRVAIEQAATIMAGIDQPCPPGYPCRRDKHGVADCRRCWREYLEAR